MEVDLVISLFPFFMTNLLKGLDSTSVVNIFKNTTNLIQC